MNTIKQKQLWKYTHFLTSRLFKVVLVDNGLVLLKPEPINIKNALELRIIKVEKLINNSSWVLHEK